VAGRRGHGRDCGRHRHQAQRVLRRRHPGGLRARLRRRAADLARLGPAGDSPCAAAAYGLAALAGALILAALFATTFLYHAGQQGASAADAAWNTWLAIWVDGFRHWNEIHGSPRLGGPFYYYGLLLLVYEPLVPAGAVLATVIFSERRRAWLAAVVGAAIAGLFAALISMGHTAAVERMLHLRPAYLVLLLPAVTATGWAVVSLWRSRRETLAFLFFFSAVQTLLYSYAGEKVPWLVVHLAVPWLVVASAAIVECWEHTRAAVQRALLVIAAGVLVVPSLSGTWALLTFIDRTSSSLFCRWSTVPMSGGSWTSREKWPASKRTRHRPSSIATSRCPSRGTCEISRSTTPMACASTWRARRRHAGGRAGVARAVRGTAAALSRLEQLDRRTAERRDPCPRPVLVEARSPGPRGSRTSRLDPSRRGGQAHRALNACDRCCRSSVSPELLARHALDGADRRTRRSDDVAFLAAEVEAANDPNARTSRMLMRACFSASLAAIAA